MRRAFDEGLAAVRSFAYAGSAAKRMILGTIVVTTNESMTAALPIVVSVTVGIA